MTTRVTVALLLLMMIHPVAEAQQPPSMDDPDALLKQALRYGDLYNWSDAASLFSRAERLYGDRGDSRDAFYAKLGRIRSTMEQLSLPEVSEELGNELDHNPILQNDKQLRLFCWIVRGDIDGELDAAPMRRDWEAALKLAQELGDKKWQNRATGEIGFSMFLEGNMTAARQRIGSALMGAMLSQDIGAQIRYMAAIGQGLVLMGSYDEGLGYLDKALKIASGTPDAGYQFIVQEGRLEAFKAKGMLDTAQQLADELITQARARGKRVKETQTLITASTMSVAKHDDTKAIAQLENAIKLAESGGFKRLLADAQVYLADIYRERGDLPRAEKFALAAVDSTQSGGEIYLLPRRLQSVAELQASQGKYRDADATFDRAEDILDTMIGNVRSIQAKIGLITSMSEIYTEHVALIADRFTDFNKAYSVVERARGRSTTDLLMSGQTLDSPEEEQFEKQVSRLNLDLTRAKSRDAIRKIRAKIFVAEEGRWTASASSPWKAHSWETIPVEQIQGHLGTSDILLEYVIAQPHSYCLVITREAARIIPLADRATIETLVNSYVNTLRKRGSAPQQGNELYSVLVKPIPETAKKSRLIIVPDGCLHLLPFDALVDPEGRYLVFSKTISYSPSASAYYMLNNSSPQLAQSPSRTVLAVGGIPYSETADLNKVLVLRGYSTGALSDLPSSREEIQSVQATFRDSGDTLLTGQGATEAAFKHADLSRRAIVHLAVHGIANPKDPQHAALILLSDPRSEEDGILEADEIIHLHTNADLVVLSACDTAVGRLQGEEGIANLSRAFLLSGAKTVVSTLWSIDDVAALYLMKRFYLHLGQKMAISDALTGAKRDLLRTYGQQAVPYYWASFKLEGIGTVPVSINSHN